MSEDQILDQAIGGDEEGKKHVMRNLASGGKRFANYIIDTIFFYILLVVLGMFAGVFAPEAMASTGIFFSFGIYLSYVLYYWAFEALTGRTIGKYITRTKIVKEDGSKPDGINVLGRSFSRLIPFDAFSFLGSPGKGWHDSIPKIYVIDDK